MACRGKVSVVVVAVLLVLVAEPQVTFVNGDAALINNVCAQTPNPNACHQCFDLYQQSATEEDVKALGQTSIDCATFATSMAINTAGDSVDSATNDDARKAYNYCLDRLYEGDLQITNAVLSWQSGNYAAAADQVVIAVDTSRDCMNRVSKFNPPTTLVDKITQLQGFCQASSGVLKQIH